METEVHCPLRRSNAVSSICSSLSVFSFFLDISRYLPLSLYSFPLAQNLWRGSGGGSSVFELEAASIPRKPVSFRTKDSSPHVLLHKHLIPDLIALQHPGLASPPHLASASCFRTRPVLSSPSLLRIYEEQPPFLCEPQREQLQRPH